MTHHRSDALGLLLVSPPPRLPQRARAGWTGGMAAVAVHALVVTLLVTLGARAAIAPRPHSSGREPLRLPRMIFVPASTPGGGGGGGHPLQKPPARTRQEDRPTSPAPARVLSSETVRDAPSTSVLLDARPVVAGTDVLFGLPDARPSTLVSQGPGFGGGSEGGSGTGGGSGVGGGVGPGSGDGFGGAYGIGNGVVAPTLLRHVKPKYTTEALRQKIQGTVVLDVVVGRDGIPGAIRVARSLDPDGLDVEAVATVRAWRFLPGRLGETPVDVLVRVMLDFHIN
jgi:periplasmic protein TonB